jgi:hypothetical protein
MSNHPLKMKDKLKNKKRPTAKCRIFVGDHEEYRQSTEQSFVKLVELFKDFKPDTEMPEPLRIAGKELFKDFSEVQEPFFQTFVFRAMHPVAFEKLLDAHPARPNIDELGYNHETLRPVVFKECLIEPEYVTQTDEEWEAFFNECSHKEYNLLMSTAMEANLRNIELSTPKDLMTQLSK